MALADEIGAVAVAGALEEDGVDRNQTDLVAAATEEVDRPDVGSTAVAAAAIHLRRPTDPTPPPDADGICSPFLSPPCRL